MSPTSYDAEQVRSFSDTTRTSEAPPDERGGNRYMFDLKPPTLPSGPLRTLRSPATRSAG